jgi:hypothetical protein
MTQYLIAFDDGDMIFPAEELPDVAKAAAAVVREARAAGAWVFGAGLEHHEVVSVMGRQDRRRLPLRAAGLRAPTTVA